MHYKQESLLTMLSLEVRLGWHITCFFECFAHWIRIIHICAAFYRNYVFYVYKHIYGANLDKQKTNLTQAGTQIHSAQVARTQDSRRLRALNWNGKVTESPRSLRISHACSFPFYSTQMLTFRRVTVSPCSTRTDLSCKANEEQQQPHTRLLRELQQFHVAKLEVVEDN